MSTGINIRHYISVLLTALAILIATAPATGRAQELSAEQQRMLDQLPPAQRAQAVQALRQIRAQGTTRAPVEERDEPAPLPSSADSSAGATDAIDYLAGARSRLIIRLESRQDGEESTARRPELDPVLERIRGTNFYELDDDGQLGLPGLTPIPVKGLDAPQIEARLEAVPLLRDFDIEVTILPIAVSGIEALEPFGYDLFQQETAALSPITSGPVPPDYVLGPGDSVRVQMFGTTNAIYEFEVTRDGILNLPDIGPIPVAGLTFSDFRSDIERRVGEALIGTEVSVSMGQLRTIQVFVLGDVPRPGSHVVGSLATISTALYAAGGVSDIGSLRRVRLNRQGQTIATFDLYDMLLRGDTGDDVRLAPGDAVFVPPILQSVGISGAIRRPAIYELTGPTSVRELIDMAGGLRPDAFVDAARIERVSTQEGRIVVDASIEVDGGNQQLSNGDTLIIPVRAEQYSGSISLNGAVAYPGRYEWRPEMTLTDVLGSFDAVLPGADLNYVLIRRTDPRSQAVSVRSASLVQALLDPQSSQNVALSDRDSVFVFRIEDGRRIYLDPLLDELKTQSMSGDPVPIARISGGVRSPGDYPLEPGMRISDLLRAGGDLAESAFVLQAELTRYSTVNGELRTAELIDVDLQSVLNGEPDANLVLQPHDYLLISTVPDWDLEASVEILGEVRFPGEYRIRPRETLQELLHRAGGLTEDAYTDGAVFLRESLREREQEQIEALAQRLEQDITSMSLETIDTTGAEALDTGRELLGQLRATEAVGRLVIDLDAILDISSDDTRSVDIVLRDEDRLLVPRRPQEVTVIGEIQHNTSHMHRPGLTRDDYIAMSGGLTRRADKSLIYVVRASGAVVTNRPSRWFSRRGANTEIQAGDTIIVPIETNRVRPLNLWTSVTQILYQSALAIAAVRTFDN